MNIILIYFAIKYEGDWDKIYEALELKEKVPFTEIQKLEKMIANKEWKICTILDQKYPNKLKQAYKPPFVFWYKGNLDFLTNKFIILTGNLINAIDKKRICDFIPEIIKTYRIVTSSYPGIDKEILSVSKNTKRLFISASGIDIDVFSSKPLVDDFVFTEYPPSLRPTQTTYRNRNRIVASFSHSLILFSSVKNGPINNLVSNFLDLGKEIFCFPGDGSKIDGNSDLIKQGANLITEIKDISN